MFSKLKSLIMFAGVAFLLSVMAGIQIANATEITLTQAQIDQILAAHCECTEPPVDPPVEPPVEPPVQPPVNPPIQPPGDLYPMFWSDIWLVRLSTDKSFYSNQYVYNRAAAGTSVAIRLPTLTGNYKLKITDIETVGADGVRREGVLSWRRDFDRPYLGYHVWGLGGGVVANLTPADSGKTLYFNHRIMPQDGQYAPWWSTLTATFRRR